MKKIIEKIRDYIDGGLREMCGRMSPDKRFITIIALGGLFAIVNIYVTFRAIYNIGREDARREQIEITPLSTPDFPLRDSVQHEHLNSQSNGNE